MNVLYINSILYEIVFKAFTHLFCATCFQRSILLLFIHFRLCKGYLAEMHLVEQLRVAVPVASQSLCPTKLALLVGHHLGLRAGILYWDQLHHAYHNHQPRLHHLPHPNFHLSHHNLVPLLAAYLEAHLIYRFVINVYSFVTNNEGANHLIITFFEIASTCNGAIATNTETTRKSGATFWTTR